MNLHEQFGNKTLKVLGDLASSGKARRHKLHGEVPPKKV